MTLLSLEVNDVAL